MDINIKGTIVNNDEKWLYDLFEIENTSPKDVFDVLSEANGMPVDVYINSGGGMVFAGSEIYTALRGYRGGVKIHVTGLAASAASVIMCAGHCDISPTGMVMIHNVSGGASGDYRDMEHEADVLRTASKALCAAYVEKTGRDEAELLELMDQEKWFTAQEAVEMGLCDEITGDGMQLVAAASPVIPAVVIEKLKDIIANERKKAADMIAAVERFAKLEAKV